ncbi:MAG: 3-dehydroquinate synthase [Bacteroidota bacterium]|jgi:3-dehydroquinate synthase
MIWCGLDIATEFSEALSSRFDSTSNNTIAPKPDVFFLCSHSTHSLCLSFIDDCVGGIPESNILTIPDGEEAKSLIVCESIFNWLQSNNAQRGSLLINIGGGALCDVGGFCASTYLRGIEFWNIPTTLLAMVDASVGGKTGINLGHYKNYIGTFTQASHIFITPHWLKTLPQTEILSGWAEVIKHGILLGGKAWQQVQQPMPNTNDYQAWLSILQWNIKIKSRIVSEDFEEKGQRKLLNLGHTIGHALESFSLDQGKAIPHGFAVAWGLALESALAISVSTEQETSQDFHQCIKEIVQNLYPPIHFTQSDIPALMNYIRADKKNNNDTLLFSMAFAPGDCRFNIPVAPESIIKVLNDYVGHPH